MTNAIGWLSSLVLLLTIGTQIHRQWRKRTSEGVSPWLFVGQMVASAGFSIYSALVHDWVFIVTNSLMLVSAAVGLGIVVQHRRSAGHGPRRNDVPARRAPLSGASSMTSKLASTGG